MFFFVLDARRRRRRRHGHQSGGGSSHERFGSFSPISKKAFIYSPPPSPSFSFALRKESNKNGVYSKNGNGPKKVSSSFFSFDFFFFIRGGIFYTTKTDTIVSSKSPDGFRFSSSPKKQRGQHHAEEASLIPLMASDFPSKLAAATKEFKNIHFLKRQQKLKFRR